MFDFLQNLDNDIRDALLIQLRNLWTHTSTAIEGNTLTLCETEFVLEEGLTVSGKPLKDHEEVVGHARAIDLIYDLIRRKSDLTENDLFGLHKAIQTERIFDVYKPVGAWKSELNSTVIVSGDTQTIFEFAAPEDVPELMQSWLAMFQKTCKELSATKEAALSTYAHLHVSFVRIHPLLGRQWPDGPPHCQCPRHNCRLSAHHYSKKTTSGIHRIPVGISSRCGKHHFPK